MAEYGFDINRFVKAQDRAVRKIVKKKNKEVKRLSNIKIKQLITKEGRVPIPAKRKKEVREKYKNKCAKCPTKSPLQIHHKNGKNNDNRLANLILLCANHHYKIHAKGSKLNKTIRKRSTRRNSLFRF